MADVDRAAWNRLVNSDYPFLRHEFLQAAEDSGSATPETGWTPRHLTLSDASGLRAAMPLYEKNHSWGEFVFDWAWAQAYERAGLDYYPKLVSAVPFTPAPSSRLLLRDANDQDAAELLLQAATELAAASSCSSLHLQFPTAAESSACEALDFKIRKDCQFHWHNRDYRSFNDFLATFSSRKRKKVRQDRRRVYAAGITLRHVQGADMSAADWQRAYELISITFLRRGSTPYFTQSFFETLSQDLPQCVRVVFAEQAQRQIAAAVFFVGGSTLYGRYWGSDAHYNALHFETCYYQGIEFCIAAGLETFEPGTQGEHKIARGFTPVVTRSAHWLSHPQFFAAIGDYVHEEARYVDRYMQAVTDHSPYRD